MNNCCQFPAKFSSIPESYFFTCILRLGSSDWRFRWRQEYPVLDGVRLSPPHLAVVDETSPWARLLTLHMQAASNSRTRASLQEKRADSSLPRWWARAVIAFAALPRWLESVMTFFGREPGKLPSTDFLLLFFFSQKCSTDKSPISHCTQDICRRPYPAPQRPSPWRPYSRYFIHFIRHSKRWEVFKEGLIWDLLPVIYGCI